VRHPEHLYFNIVDGSTLERGIYLTTQLRELGVNVIVLLNMMDVVRKRSMEIDIDALKQSMSCEVIPISLKETLDFSALSQAIEDFNPATFFHPLTTLYYQLNKRLASQQFYKIYLLD
jgi:ferrous iron transport protein B